MAARGAAIRGVAKRFYGSGRLYSKKDAIDHAHNGSMYLVDPTGTTLRAAFFVERYRGSQSIVLESAGGSGTRDYNETLTLLLRRLAAVDGLLTDALVESRVTRKLSEPERRLVLRHGRKFPIHLRSTDIDELRKAIGAAQEPIGQRPGATAGNRTKRIRLAISTSSFPVPDLERYLSTGQSGTG